MTLPATVLQTPTMIEPTTAQDVISIPPSQPTVTPITTVTLLISLPIQTVSGPLQAVGGSIVPLIPTDDPTVQILSLDAHLAETTEVFDPSNINITDSIPEMTLDTSTNISFEKGDSDEEPTMFSRDEELKELNRNAFTEEQLQTAEQVRQQYGDKRPQPQFPNLTALTSGHKPKPVVTKNHNRTLLDLPQKTPWRRPMETRKFSFNTDLSVPKYNYAAHQETTIPEISKRNYTGNKDSPFISNQKQ